MVALEVASSFVVGIAASGSPCALPLYPGFLAYVTGRAQTVYQRRLGWVLGLVVLLGVLVSMSIVWLVTASLRLSTKGVVLFLDPIINTALIAGGAWMLLGSRGSAWLPQKIRIPASNNPWLEAFAYGALYGPITLPCSLPAVFAFFALAISVVDFFLQAFLFFVFGLGLGLPLLAIAVVSRARQTWLAQSLTRHHRSMSTIAGLLLLGIGFYGLIVLPGYIDGLIRF